mgnify:CR=1 FL=1
MNYEEAIETLRHLAKKKGINYSLERLDPFLEALNNPHLQLKNCIHIAGTNGKGSTVAFLKSILIGMGFSVGTYTSPHKHSYRERISIDNKPISEAAFCRLFNDCLAFHEQGLTEFETLTLMSFLYFNEMKPDYILYETGLGGRLDATNVIQPKLCIITSIDYDHQAILGDTLEQIAKEKAGIIKTHTPLITPLNQDERVLTILNETCTKKNAALIPVAPLSALPEGTKLKATCQKENAALAKAAVKLLEFRCNDDIIDRGIKEAYLWGRFEEKIVGDKLIILDGAHNKASVQTLVDSFKATYKDKKPAIIFGVHQSKSVKDIIEGLLQISDNLYYCEFDNEFATPFEQVKKESPVKLKPYVLNEAIDNEDFILFTGSFYFLGHLKV